MNVELDAGYVRVLDSLVAVDQKTNRYFKSINNGVLGELGKDTMNRLTKSNVEHMHKLFSKKYPSDNMVGRPGMPWGRVPYSVILIHNAQSDTYHHLDDVLYSAVETGDLAPEEFEYWVSVHFKGIGKDTLVDIKNQKIKVPLFSYDFIQCHDSLFQFPPVLEKVNECERNRKLLMGVCSMEELKTKIVFQYYHPKYHFVENDYVFKLDIEMPSLLKKCIYIGDKTKR
jgi:hypothetical protein